MPPLIRPLDPSADLADVEALYQAAADFWQMTDRRPPDRHKAEAFFIDTPPGCDPAASHRLGLFEHFRLMGVAELSFGFPNSNSAYLGLMVLAPSARGRGLGRVLLAEVEVRARKTGAAGLYLAVLDANPKGRAFWEREGFRDTGVGRFDDETGHWVRRMHKTL